MATIDEFVLKNIGLWWQAHFSQLCCLQVRSVTPWQSHDKKSRCLRGRRHNSILYSPSVFFSSYFINEVNDKINVQGQCYRHGMCFRMSCVFVSSILFWFPQHTHYVWRVFRFLFMERTQDYSVVYKYDQWPHDSHMTGRAGVWEADDIIQFYIALLDFFPATL
jgi:hypothetical protein